MASLHTLTVPRLDLIFPEHFQDGLPIDGAPILGWSNQELLFRWTSKVKNLTPEQLLFKWRSEDNPYGVMRSDLNASIRRWETISSEALQNDLKKLCVQLSTCLSTVHAMDTEPNEGCSQLDEISASSKEQRSPLEEVCYLVDKLLVLSRECCSRADEVIALSREQNVRSKECCARADEAIASSRELRAQLKERCSRADEITASSSEVHSQLDAIAQRSVQGQLVNRAPVITDHLSWFGQIMNHLSQFIVWVKESVLTICGRLRGQ
jgi:hypothetical protein